MSGYSRPLCLSVQKVEDPLFRGTGDTWHHVVRLLCCDQAAVKGAKLCMLLW